MDIQLPVMDGCESTTILRKNGFKKPIIACTANVMKQDKARYFSIGCDDLITKPIDRRHFQAVIEKYLRPINEESTSRQDNSNDPAESLRSRILVVAVSPNIGAMVKEILSMTQAVVDQANTGQSLVERALAEDYNLILLDMQIPNIEESLNSLGQLNCQSVIVAFDSTFAADTQAKLCPPGCVRLITNGLDKSKVKRLMADHLAGWSDAANADVGCILDEADNDYDATFGQLCHDFLSGLPSRITKINDAAYARNWKTVGYHLHTLKGAGGNFAQPHITALASNAEKLLKEEDFPQLHQMIIALTSHCHDLMGE